MVPAIDPTEVPFPFPPGVPPHAYTRRGGQMQMVPLPGALAAGTAQWPYGFTRLGGRLSDSEGILAFYDDRLIFLADSGEDTAVPYESITGMALKKALPGPLKKVTLQAPDRPGMKFQFKLGPELAANAQYILSAVAARPKTFDSAGAPSLEPGPRKTPQSPPSTAVWAGGAMTSVGRLDGVADAESDGLVIRGTRRWTEQWPDEPRQDYEEQTTIRLPWNMIESADIPEVGKLRLTPKLLTDYLVIQLYGLDDEKLDAWVRHIRLHGVMIERTHR